VDREHDQAAVLREDEDIDAGDETDANDLRPTAAKKVHFPCYSEVFIHPFLASKDCYRGSLYSATTPLMAV
jgi:hypothetical protein